MLIYAPNHICTYAHQTKLSEFYFAQIITE